MMKLLAIETSSAVGSVALFDGSAITERWIDTPREQTDRVLPIVEELLVGADMTLKSLDAIVFGRGPGSFTGMRVAAAITQGLAMSTAVPVVAVSSMAGAAQRAWREASVTESLVCIDARMGEVYWALFSVNNELAELRGSEHLCEPAAVEAPVPDSWAAVGNGFVSYPDALAELSAAAMWQMPDLTATARDLLPRARHECAAGRTIDARQALPVYLRDETAWRKLP